MVDDDESRRELRRSYILGPFVLEEWLEQSEETKKIFLTFSKENPHLNVTMRTIVPSIPDWLYIQIDVDEFEDNQEDC